MVLTISFWDSTALIIPDDKHIIFWSGYRNKEKAFEKNGVVQKIEMFLSILQRFEMVMSLLVFA